MKLVCLFYKEQYNVFKNGDRKYIETIITQEKLRCKGGGDWIKKARGLAKEHICTPPRTQTVV